MGASESTNSYSSSPASNTRNQLTSSRAEPDGFQVLRVQSERNEIQIGEHRLETRRVNVSSASARGNRLQVHQRQHVEVRVQSTPRSGAGLEWRAPRQLMLGAGDSSDEDSQCTYDDDGAGFYLQPWFKCYTCWGGESSFGCCSHCASTCHRDHRLESCGLQKAECDCGQNKHQNAVCTWNVTKRSYVKQPFYRCFDCFHELNEGVCYQCWKICHRTHNTSYAGIMSAFCDCGLDCCRIKCSIASPK